MKINVLRKLLELYDTKAIGICGVDIETIQMMIKNDYIPVIVPNDIDNEMEHIESTGYGSGSGL